ncbi:hypothetical protein C8J57DRAFT_1095850 [Mycena rebaudengoi]|nr:hypothetical protein C8J57DRAFT_1095850 [Mycena rebaudengoi]
MAEWHPLMQFFLDERLRMAGLGDYIDAPCCSLCDQRVRSDFDQPFFKCTQCGEFLQCQECCLKRHALMPLHFLKKWNGTFWQSKTLLELGLIYQIGHEGHPCPFPAQEVRNMTVIDTTGIHQIRYRYCDCTKSTKTNNLSQLLRNTWYPASVTTPTTCATFNVLDLFRLLSIIGNVNCHDFIGSLERLTDPTAVTGMQ